MQVPWQNPYSESMVAMRAELTCYDLVRWASRNLALCLALLNKFLILDFHSIHEGNDIVVDVPWKCNRP
jgi:hypothetical protein